ncbi:hypothetical protein NIES4106_58710 (plasmid) [Fischerella sp. NIES-4106]|nr:hypothetical protein NIES4106_58710 [Fischerella sp. NIES-4106]
MRKSTLNIEDKAKELIKNESGEQVKRWYIESPLLLHSTIHATTHTRGSNNSFA